MQLQKGVTLPILLKPSRERQGAVRITITGSAAQAEKNKRSCLKQGWCQTQSCYKCQGEPHD